MNSATDPAWTAPKTTRSSYAKAMSGHAYARYEAHKSEIDEQRKSTREHTQRQHHMGQILPEIRYFHQVLKDAKANYSTIR